MKNNENNENRINKSMSVFICCVLIALPLMSIFLFIVVQNIFLKIVFGVTSILFVGFSLIVFGIEIGENYKKRKFVITSEDYSKIAFKFYDEMDKELSKLVYPDGQNQIYIIIKSLVKLDKVIYKYKYVKKERCKVLFDLYCDIYQKIKLGFYSDRMLIEILIGEEYSFDKDYAWFVLAYIQMNIENNKFNLYENDNSMKQLSFWVDQLNNKFKLSIENKELLNKNIGDEEYGRVPNKPIFVEGNNQELFYFVRLRTIDNERVDVSKIGTMKIDGISGEVDIIEINYKGKCEQLYVCPYSILSEKSSPRGLVLISIDSYFEDLRKMIKN